METPIRKMDTRTFLNLKDFEISKSSHDTYIHKFPPTQSKFDESSISTNKHEIENWHATIPLWRRNRI